MPGLERALTRSGEPAKRKMTEIPEPKDKREGATEPEWEARFDPRSYGFRRGRGCQDAIQAVHETAKGKAKRLWALDADLASAFDLIAHQHILSQIGTFPARGMVRAWLKAVWSSKV